MFERFTNEQLSLIMEALKGYRREMLDNENQWKEKAPIAAEIANEKGLAAMVQAAKIDVIRQSLVYGQAAVLKPSL